MMFSNYQGPHPMSDYFSAMDSEFYGEGVPKEGEPAGKNKEPGALGVEDVGMSVPLGISAQNVQGVYSKIRSGTGNIELGFAGTIRGTRQAQTPEMYGEDQRQALRELAAINEVKFTTHSAYGIMGLSGFTGDNPYNVWFQKEYKKQAVDEIKRAIEFARDAAGGGSVVVHTGEIERPITDIRWNRREDGKPMFRQYEDEAELTRVRVVDDRTGQVTQIRKNMRVARPDWKRAKSDYMGVDINDNPVKINGPLLDENGKIKLGPDGFPIFRGDYLDLLGRKIPEDMIEDPIKGRVPEYDNETRSFKNEHYDWHRIEEETKERNQRLARHKGISVEELHRRGEAVLPEEIHVRSTMETQEAHARGWGSQYSSSGKMHIDRINKLKEAIKYYEQLENSVPKDELWKIMKRDHLFFSGEGEMIPADLKRPTEILRDKLKQEEVGLLFANQGGQGQQLHALDNREQQKHMISATKYAVEEAVKGYAEAAIHAMDCSIDPNKPVVITMENIFPERYGGHPQELKDLINKARDEMVKRLTEPKIEDPSRMKDYAHSGESAEPEKRYIDNPYFRGMDKEQAKKLAETHIKATLDTGHLNIWKKYWQNDPKKTLAQNDSDFRSWLLNQVEDLAKGGYIGNVHLTDNFGYQDDHLAPGQGNTPVKEVAALLKKHGYDKAWTVEPGADASTDNSDFHGLMKSWRYFGSPVYGAGMRVGAPQSWGDVQYSYFGQEKPPYFIFGAYSPSNDWTLWTATPME